MGFRYQKSKLGIENEAPFSAIYFTFSARKDSKHLGKSLKVHGDKSNDK